MSLMKNLQKIGENIGKAVVNVVDRVANRAEFEAVVAACVLVATADGVTAAAERQASLAAIAGHPALAAFKSADTTKLFESYLGLMGAGREPGTLALIEKIKALDSEGKARVIGVAQKIAEADGTVDATELEMINRLKAL